MNQSSKYSILFILVSILTFGYFILNGKSFVWHLDGYAQHCVALTYYGTWLRDIARNILIEHTFSIPMWDFSIGYGGDIITTLNYYVLGEPINLLSAFVPSRYTEYLYAFLIIFRLYLAGRFFIQFCNIMNKKGNGVVAGALIYVFTGYMMYGATRHPFFILPIMFFPLMLTGVEKILKGKKPYQFIFTIVLSAISNFYFFYMVAVLTVIYTLVRCGFIYKKNLKTIFTKLAVMLLYAIIAIMISAIIFLPVVMLFLSDSRSGVNTSVPLIYDLSYYQKLLSGFISSDSGGYWNFMGYSPIVILGLFFMFKKRDVQKIVFFAICIIFITIPAMGSLMNGLSYVSNRWIWAFAMLCAYLVVEYWNDIIAISSKCLKQIFIVLAVYTTLICIMKNTRLENVLIELLILVFTVMALNYINQNNKISRLKSEKIIIGAIIAGVAVNSFYIYSVSEGGYVKEFIDSGKVYESYKSSQSSDINKHVKDNEFFRFTSAGEEFDNTTSSKISMISTDGILKDHDLNNSRIDFCDNSAMLFDVNGIGFYWSLGNSNVSDYLTKMGALEYATFFYHGIDDRAPLLSLSSVKYYISEKGNDSVIPYGFEKYDTFKKSVPYGLRNKKITEYNKDKYKTKYNLYVNNFALPLGYTYDQVISENDFDKYSNVEKEEVMLQAAVLEETDNADEISKINTSDKELDYKITCHGDVEYKNNSFIVGDTGANVFIEFDESENTGLYAKLDNLKYTPMNPLSQFEEQIDSLSRIDRNILKNKYEYWKKPTNVSIYFKYNGTYKQLIYYANNQSYYNGRDDFVINLGYSKVKRNGIYISFSQKGTYAFDNLSLIEQSFENYENNINNLKEDVLTDVAMNDNLITGSIDLDKKKLLCLTIPYNDGWKIYVDGKESNLQKVNLMYSGVFLEPGEHNIRLEYCTPGIKLGAVISVIGLVALLIVIVVNKKSSK